MVTAFPRNPARRPSRILLTTIAHAPFRGSELAVLMFEMVFFILAGYQETSINCQDLCSYMNRCSRMQRYFKSF